MLHREQARGHPARHADLHVDVLDVVASRLGSDHQACAICLLDKPSVTSRRTSTSRAVSPAGPSRRRTARCPPAASTASTASRSSRPALTSARSCEAAS